MTPDDDKVIIAYDRGVEAAKQGKPKDANPYDWIGAKHGGLVLGGWWTKGFDDYLAQHHEGTT